MSAFDVIIIGAGAAGLMCAHEAGKRQRKVLVLDHANKPGKKILMSGGGRCNFTNHACHPSKFISYNPAFCKSALSRYTQDDFIALVKKHNIPFHEKTLGQLFCNNKSHDILNLLLAECKAAQVKINLNTVVYKIEKLPHQFHVVTQQGMLSCSSLVIATGGLSIPTLGASPFGYKIAEQFGIKVQPTRAALVPFTLQPDDKEKFSVLAGIAVDSLVSNTHISFRENILFTHRGLSGPAILQISSYWQPGEDIVINLLPELSLLEHLKKTQQTQGAKQLNTILTDFLPRRLIEVFIHPTLAQKKLSSIGHREFAQIAAQLHSWRLKPNGTEGYRTAEVTLGGVDCSAVSSKSMEVHQVPGLYFIGEVLDVSGWLGGYNFQWAWSSGWAAGQVV